MTGLVSVPNTRVAVLVALLGRACRACAVVLPFVFAGAARAQRTTDIDAYGVIAEDAGNDGSFETLVFDPVVLIVRETPQRADRGLFDVPLVGVWTGATVTDAALHTRVQWVNGPVALEVLGYVGDLRFTTSDATASTRVVGNAANVQPGDLVIPIDPALLNEVLARGAANPFPSVGLTLRLVAGEELRFEPTGPDYLPQLVVISIPESGMACASLAMLASSALGRRRRGPGATVCGREATSWQTI